MVLTYLLTAISLIYMLALVGFVVYKIRTLDRKGKLEFIKSFKKGKFALIYLATIILFFLGSLYEGVPAWGSLLNAVKNSVDSVVLKYNYSAVASLMQANVFYRITVDICFILVACNAVVFTLALVGQKLYNWIICKRTYNKEQKVYVILGDNEQNRSIIKSAKQEKVPVLLIVDKIDDQIRDYAFVEKIALDSFSKDVDIGTQILTSFKNCSTKLINVIVNTEDDAKDLIYVEKMSQAILANDLEGLSIIDDYGLNCYVFGEPENASAFGLFTKNTKGCVHYINKYKLFAIDFVGKYPLTQFMTEAQIDYSSATIKPEVEMNVVMIGFGKTNRQIFLTSVANNQFLTKVTGEDGTSILKEKPVNYYVYDNRNAEQDKNLNHDYFRYSREYPSLKARHKEYLEIPPIPANEKFLKIDVNDGEFYSSLKENLAVGGKHAYNYVLIAYGSDMENLDFAEKVCEKLTEWELIEQTKVFVKIRNDMLSDEVIEKEYSDKFIVFGNENKIVYNVRQIFAEQHEKMAKDKHLTYIFAQNPGNEMEIKEKDLYLTTIPAGEPPKKDETKKEKDDEKESPKIKISGEAKNNYLLNYANKEWYEDWVQVQRDSNTYACLSIRMKLHLLGFDFKKGIHEDASEEFMKKYEEGDKPNRAEQEIMGLKPVNHGDCHFKRGTIRNNLATQEHQRWNAYHICHGYVPATIEETKANEKKKLLNMRKHRNILTYDGLIQFCHLMMEIKKPDYAENDVIKYDYQILDDLTWLASRVGYTIVKK